MIYAAYNMLFEFHFRKLNVIITASIEFNWKVAMVLYLVLSPPLDCGSFFLSLSSRSAPPI